MIEGKEIFPGMLEGGALGGNAREGDVLSEDAGDGFGDRLRGFLDAKVEQYNQPGFIADDPVCIPHLFSRKQDIEIMGFWAAMLAWGQRKTIIAKCRQLIDLMDGAPYDFIKHHQPADLKPFLAFKHRTFNATDTLYFIAFFQQHYAQHESLEAAFTVDVHGEDARVKGARINDKRMNGTRRVRRAGMEDIQMKDTPFIPGPGGSKAVPCETEPVEAFLNNFRRRFFSLPDFPRRTMKHVSAPERDSACKRLNMFLRWMVRDDDRGVDFGLWKDISPAQLICPCDVHVERVARKLRLIRRSRGGWQTALELTRNLRKLDPADPVKYDFALFGMGVAGEI